MENENNVSARLNFGNSDKPLGASFLPTDEQLAQSEAENASIDETAPEEAASPVSEEAVTELPSEVLAPDTPVVSGSALDTINKVQAERERLAEAETQAEAPAVEISIHNETENDPVAKMRAESDRLRSEAEKLASERKVEALKQVIMVCKTYSITSGDIVSHLGEAKKTRKSSPAKPKYRDPVTGKEWSGRGKAPLWIKDKNKEDFLIK